MSKIKINRYLIIILMIGLSLLFALGITLIYRKTVYHAGRGHETVVTLHPADSKNSSSWGKELRFYYIMLNDKAIDLSKMKLPSGWSYDGTFLFYSGSGSDLVIPYHHQLTSLNIKCCKQNGSGIVHILVNGNVVKVMDLYSNDWPQADYGEVFVTRLNMMEFGLGVALFSFFLLFLIYRKFRIGSDQNVVIVNSLGMFDCAKGIGILLVLWVHSVGLYGDVLSKILQAGYLTSLPKTFIATGLMPAFAIVSGYGFKKKSMKKCITSLSQLLLLPYLYVAAAVTVIWTVISITGHTSVKSSLLQYSLPFLTNAFHIGPMWFIVAIYFGTILVNLLMRINNKSVNHITAVLLYIAGIITFDFEQIPYIIPISLIGAGYIYLGYCIKKSGLLLKNTIRTKAYISLGAFVAILLAVLYNYVDHVPDLVYLFMEQIIKLLCGLFLLSGALWFNRFTGRLIDGVRVVGRFSYWILCIHSIEYLCIPWRELNRFLGENSYLVISATMLCRALICGVVCYLLYLFKRSKHNVFHLRSFVAGNR